MSSYDQSAWNRFKDTLKRWFNTLKRTARGNNEVSEITRAPSTRNASKPTLASRTNSTKIIPPRSESRAWNASSQPPGAAAARAGIAADQAKPQMSRTTSDLRPEQAIRKPMTARTFESEEASPTIPLALNEHIRPESGSSTDKDISVNEDVEQTAMMKEMAVKSKTGSGSSNPRPGDGASLSVDRDSKKSDKNVVKLVDIKPAAQRVPVDKVDPTTAPEVVNHFDDEKMPVVSEPTPTGPGRRPMLPPGMSATSGPLEDFPMGADQY